MSELNDRYELMEIADALAIEKERQEAKVQEDIARDKKDK